MKHENHLFDIYQFDLLNVFTAIILLVLLATHLPFFYEGLKTRRRVTEILAHALVAQKIVDQNFTKNLRLDNEWIDTCPGCIASIGIDGKTGMITIRFPDDIDAGGKTLVLLPIIEFKGGKFLLAGDSVRGTFSNNRAIVWLCTSAQTRFNDPILQSKKGTLRSNYAPNECRYLPRQYAHVEN